MENLGGVVFVLYIGTIFWVWRDALSRNMAGGKWAISSFLFSPLIVLPIYFFKSQKNSKITHTKDEDDYGPKIVVGLWLGFITVVFLSMYATARVDVETTLTKILNENDLSQFKVDLVSIPYSSAVSNNYVGTALLTNGENSVRISFDVFGEDLFGSWYLEIPGTEMHKLVLKQ